jgi:hypothetical protein
MPKRYRAPRSASTRARAARAWASLIALATLGAVPAVGQQQPDIEASLHGLILINAFHTTDNVNNSDVPQFAVAPSDASPEGSASSATARQSRLTAFALVPEFAGGVLEGELDVDFFGGQQPSTGGRTFPLLRLRRAVAELTWSQVALLVGQESPPIAAVSPSSIASIGFPDFAAAGNLWLWIPQIRLAADLPSKGAGPRFGAEIAALAPTSGEAQGTFLTQPDIAERSGRPFLQGRLRARWGRAEQMGEASLGGHYGWILDAAGERVPSKALALSIWTPLGPRLDFRAEAFTGQALAGLGGGGIGQNMVRDGVPVRSAGGWAQLNLRPTPQWEIGGGGGVDDPDDEDLGETSRLRNVALEGHVTWRKLPAVVGMEVRHLRTRYREPMGDLSATHINLGMGFEF